MPAEFDAAGDCIPPTDPQQALLLAQVRRKHWHKCRPGECLKPGRPCSMGFPLPINTGGTAFNAAARRHEYYCPREGDRWVVPYHPKACRAGLQRLRLSPRDGSDRATASAAALQVLRLLNSHCCILKVCNNSWSGYMLKCALLSHSRSERQPPAALTPCVAPARRRYALKAEAKGPLKLNAAAAESLGLGHLTDTQRKVISALVIGQPVSAAEAGMELLDIKLVNFSEAVLYKQTMPPFMRTADLRYRQSAEAPLHPVDIYARRPDVPALEGVTFTRYWREFIVSPKARSMGVGAFLGRDGGGHKANYVYARAPGAPPRVVRYSDPHPSHATEAWAYNVLLSRIPFRVSEANLFSPGNVKRSYARELQ